MPSVLLFPTSAIILPQCILRRLLLRHPGLRRPLRRHRHPLGLRTLRLWQRQQDLHCRGWLHHQHSTNFLHTWSPLTPHPCHYIHRLQFLTFHILRITYLDKLRIFKRDYHLHRQLPPRPQHLHHSLRWHFLDIHHQPHLWSPPRCHRPRNHISLVLKLQIPLLHLRSICHGLQLYSKPPTFSIHQHLHHLQIDTSTPTLLMLLNDPTVLVNQKPLHPRHPLLVTQLWKQPPKSDRIAHQTNLAVHNHRPIHLRPLLFQIQIRCQILLLHPTRPNSPPSPIPLNNFKTPFAFFKLNKLNSNSSCTAPSQLSTTVDLKTNFWLHHILRQLFRHLHHTPIHLQPIHHLRLHQQPPAPPIPTYLRQPLLVHQFLVLPDPHLHIHGRVLVRARSPHQDPVADIMHPTTVRLSAIDVHALLSFDIVPQPPIPNTGELHHHKDADHLHDIALHHDIDDLPVTALLPIQYTAHEMLHADPGHLPATLAQPTLCSHPLITHPIQLELMIQMTMTLGEIGTMLTTHLDQLDLFDLHRQGILHVKCLLQKLLQKLHQAPPRREYLLGTARTQRWTTHPCHWWTSNRAISNSRRCKRLRQIQHVSNASLSSTHPMLSLYAKRSLVKRKKNSTALWTRCFEDWPSPTPLRMENKCGFVQMKER